MNIGIIFGGKSVEHEISIITAFQLKRKLENYYNISLIYVSLEGAYFDADKMSLNDFKYSNYRLLRKLKLKKKNLALVVGAMHGENGEDGLAEAFCRINGLKYLGCKAFASALCIDKYKCYLYLANNGIKMIDTVLYTYEDYLSGKNIDYFPCIAKPNKGGSSIGIEVIKNADELEEKLSKIFIQSKEVVIQPYLEDVVEYNLALNECGFSNLEKINNKEDIFSFENKYVDNFKFMHQELINEERYNDFKSIARNVYELIEASGIIRLDFFLSNNEIYVNEVNTTPGALAMYLFPDFIDVFKESVDLVLKEETKIFENKHFLLKNNINK